MVGICCNHFKPHKQASMRQKELAKMDFFSFLPFFAFFFPVRGSGKFACLKWFRDQEVP